MDPEELPEPPPPEAVLICSLREQAPYQSRKQAAEKAGISDTRWRDIENGYKFVMGTRVPVTNAPAPTVARMARVVGAVPQQLADAGRQDAAAELEALLLDIELSDLSPAQKRLVTGRAKRTTGH
jgi:hypothetical protein